jgi:hypothetical protein
MGYQYISTIQAMWSTLAQCECASNAVVLATDYHVGALDLWWGGDTTSNVGLRLTETAMRSPDEIAGNIFVLSIGAENRAGITRADWS